VRKTFLSAALALGALAALTAAPVLGQQRTLHEERSLYRNISVVQVGDERCMLFRARRGLGRESCMLVSDPDRLVFDYAPMMLSSLYLNPNPQKILIVGQGGGTLPMALKELVPNAEMDVIEIDAAVDRIARRFFMYEPTAKIRTIIEDGRVYVKRAGRQGLKYDLVMLDAFEADYIPEHMLTKEFLEEVKAIMTPNGVLAANTFSSSALYDHESVTYRSVFGTFFNLKIGNRIILTRLGGINDFAEIRANAARFDAEFRRRGGDPDQLLRLMDTRADWNANARILTDQYSPSNVLNSLPRN
jgi:spermidine synthase